MRSCPVLPLRSARKATPGYDNGYDTGYDTGYTSGDVKLDGAPSEVGVYYCLITVADGSADVESLTRRAEQISWLGNSLRIDFEITPADDTEDPTDPEQPTDPVDPEDPTDPEQPTEKPTQAPTEKPDNGKPETGDAFNPIWFVLIMVSLSGIVVLNTFRKEWVL